MIVPTVGRVVLVFGTQGKHAGPVPALICHVWSDRLINVGGFDANGMPFNATSLQLVQEEDPVPDGRHAAWMPYQKAVAGGMPPTLHAPAVADIGTTGEQTNV